MLLPNLVRMQSKLPLSDIKAAGRQRSNPSEFYLVHSGLLQNSTPEPSTAWSATLAFGNSTTFWQRYWYASSLRGLGYSFLCFCNWIVVVVEKCYGILQYISTASHQARYVSHLPRVYRSFEHDIWLQSLAGKVFFRQNHFASKVAACCWFPLSAA